MKYKGPERRKDPMTRESVSAINQHIEQTTGKMAVRIEGKFRFIPGDMKADNGKGRRG